MKTFRRISICLVLISYVMASSICLGVDENRKWQPLFDGKTLDGWTIKGGTATYAVEDGMIVGTTKAKSPNTFLCTEKEYGDFILEFEVNCDTPLNSGCQIRSHFNGREVFGYQVEISNENSKAAGGIWDEARRRMWLANVQDTPKGVEAYNDNAWNKYRIECWGDHITTYVNGILCADLVDTVDMTGFIGLQVHSIGGNDTFKVRWRNIRIIDMGRHTWVPLFDGKTLNGWHTIPGGSWDIENGVIIGRSTPEESKYGLLSSDATFKNATTRVVFKAIKGNSGYYFRALESGDRVGVNGIQAEIDATKDVGGLYETAGRGWVSQPTPDAVKSYFKEQDWNEMTVSAHGKRVVTMVNGKKAAEIKNDPGRLEGHLALQLHANNDMEVQFKAIDILVSEPFNGKDLDGWMVNGDPAKSKWAVGKAAIKDGDPGHLVAKPGDGEMINVTPEHNASLDFFSKAEYGDCHIELEVMVPKGSNSGVYVMGEYEIQVLDSFGKVKMSGGDMGAIYGAAPPKVNASKAPGVWQKYVIDWQAPKFDKNGKKIANAKFLKVELNGQILHENLEMPNQTPGGVDGREKPMAPIMFQGNHGPVAYRNIQIRPL